MAEQDRFGAHFAPGTDRVNQAKHDVGHYFGLERTAVEKAKDAIFGKDPSGAEQDVWAGYFSVGADGLKRARHATEDAFRGASGSEVDRFGKYFKGPDDPAQKAKDTFSGSSGAEMDRLGKYFKGPDDAAQKAKDTFAGTSGAEQDRYGKYFKGSEDAAQRAKNAFSGTSGAEQDRYSARFDPAGENVVDKATRKIREFEQGQLGRRNELHRAGTFDGSNRTDAPIRTATVGILQSTILPSFSFHTSMAAIAYGIARYTDRVEVKDYLWPTAQVANAWWSAVGRHVVDGVPLSTVWSSLSYPEQALLSGVTAWGLRLLYRIATRSIDRGSDDPRYVEVKKEPGFWNKAAYALFLPEAVIQTIISLPFTLPFRDNAASASLTPFAGGAELAHMAAIFLFGTGFALETLADQQLAAHQQSGSTDLNREGVWSIVRHPNYLGDTLVHASFPFFLYSCGLLHPIALLGPLANYAFLRFVGGDAQTETAQEERYRTEAPAKLTQLQQYKEEKNSFWPTTQEFGNQWFLTVLGVGVGTAMLERGLREFLLR